MNNMMGEPKRLPQVVIMTIIKNSVRQGKALSYIDLVRFVFDKMTLLEFRDGLRFCKEAELISLVDGVISLVETR